MEVLPACVIKMWLVDCESVFSAHKMCSVCVVLMEVLPACVIKMWLADWKCTLGI